MLFRSEMTPSVDVDEAWHLHLLYTHSYWDELCGKVLRRPLHHNPSGGGAANTKRFREAYLATLEAYERTFGERPPADIWPDVETRFAPPRGEADHWRIAKALVKRAAGWLNCLLAAMLLIIAMADEAVSAEARKNGGGVS